MTDRGSFFVGWSAEAPRADRRFILSAGLGLIAGGGALGATLAHDRPASGPGFWDMGRTHLLQGVLTSDSYPVLRTLDPGGVVRTVFLTSSGKEAPRFPARLLNRWVEMTGTLIVRGENRMMAVTEVALAPGPEPAGLRSLPEVDHGSVMLVGEILDAKCWFGAMRPGYGKTHKACASLCARGGLPLAFCQSGACGTDVSAPLILDADGAAHTLDLLQFVADPVSVTGRLVKVGDVMQIRVALTDIRRL